MEVASREEWVVVRRRRSKLRPATSCRQAALSTSLPPLNSLTTLQPLTFSQFDEASTPPKHTSSSHPKSFLNSFSLSKPCWDGLLQEIAPDENCKEGKRLTMKMEKAMANIASSVFFRKFSDQLQALKLLETLRAPTGSSEIANDSALVNKATLTECSGHNSAYLNGYMTSFKNSDDVSMEIVLYGVGSILLSEVSRNQLSLALLMRNKFFCAAKILVFDPVLTPLEWKVIASLGCSMLIHNEQGRRIVKVPTIFFMPHCEVSFYDNLLQANWGDNHLYSLTVLGNSFRVCQERWATSPNPQIARPNYVLQGQRHVEEHPVDASSFTVESAFNDMSWHLFPFELSYLFQPLQAGLTQIE